jgi:hypothetical protein
MAGEAAAATVERAMSASPRSGVEGDVFMM